MSLNALSESEDSIAQKVDSAYAVHKKLGSGSLEKVYEICFCNLCVFVSLWLNNYKLNTKN